MNFLEPTFFKLNEFTKIFHMITDTYGTPVYQEINPGIILIITFPFMFGLMFGDIGHGMIFLLLGIKLTVFPSKSQFLKPYRYFILFLGICSTFCGVIYNEFFSIKTNIFGTCYDINNLSCINKNDDCECPKDLLSYRRISTDCVYPLGLDPGIGISGNFLDVMNRFKMKTAIFYGVLHMSIGLVLSGLNHLYRKDYKSLWSESVAGLLILWSFIGYIVPYCIIKFFTGPELDKENDKVLYMSKEKSDG